MAKTTKVKGNKKEAKASKQTKEEKAAAVSSSSASSSSSSSSESESDSSSSSSDSESETETKKETKDASSSSESSSDEEETKKEESKESSSSDSSSDESEQEESNEKKRKSVDADEEEEEEEEEEENSDGEIIESLENEDEKGDDITSDSNSEADCIGKEIETENIGDAILSEIESSKLKNSDTSNRNDDVQSVSDELSVTASVVDSMNRKVRGKKGKLKKIQRKYADQDEHERLLRLEALGTLKGIEKQQQKKKDELMKLELREDKKNRREKQKNLQALKFSKNEKAKVSYDKHMAELKPSLDKDDVVIDIVPVFAPWPALLKYKYKVKIQPGSAKKTKTLTEILHYFKGRQVDSSSTDKEMDWPIEHEKIKTLKEQDLVLLLCVDKLKITIAGQKSTKNGGGSQKGKKSSKTGGKKRK